jgi:hypothetical protein
MISIVNAINAPPGIVHPILTEKWAWVDGRLREIYYGEDYDELNEETFYDEVSLEEDTLNEGFLEEEEEEEEENGLFKENWAWVDERLSEKYDLEPVEDVSLRQCPLTWMDYRFGLEVTHQTLEEMSYIPPIRREDPYNPFDCSKLFSLYNEDSLVDLESSLDLGSNVNSEELFSDDYDFDSEEFYNDCVKVDIGIDACIELVY